MEVQDHLDSVLDPTKMDMEMVPLVLLMEEEATTNKVQEDHLEDIMEDRQDLPQKEAEAAVGPSMGLLNLDRGIFISFYFEFSFFL